MATPGGARGDLRRGVIACWLVLSVVLGSCSSSGNGSGTDAAVAVDAGPDLPTSNTTCQQIMQCVWFCPSEVSQPCVETCVARGTAEARAAYQALSACTAPVCPTGEPYCGCEQRCFADGACLRETEECAGGPTDSICDTLCH